MQTITPHDEAELRPRTRAGRATDIDREVGQHIRRRRVALGLTQQALAGRVDVTYQQLHKYERGINRIAIGRLVKIAAALGTTVEMLLDGQGSPQFSADDREMFELTNSYRLLTQRQRDGVRALVRSLL